MVTASPQGWVQQLAMAQRMVLLGNSAILLMGDCNLNSENLKDDWDAFPKELAQPGMFALLLTAANGVSDHYQALPLETRSLAYWWSGPAPFVAWLLAGLVLWEDCQHHPGLSHTAAIGNKV